LFTLNTSSGPSGTLGTSGPSDGSSPLPRPNPNMPSNSNPTVVEASEQRETEENNRDEDIANNVKLENKIEFDKNKPKIYKILQGQAEYCNSKNKALNINSKYFPNDLILSDDLNELMMNNLDTTRYYIVRNRIRRIGTRHTVFASAIKKCYK
jgi:hypothetical protein